MTPTASNVCVNWFHFLIQFFKHLWILTWSFNFISFIVSRPKGVISTEDGGILSLFSLFFVSGWFSYSCLFEHCPLTVLPPQSWDLSWVELLLCSQSNVLKEQQEMHSKLFFPLASPLRLHTGCLTVLITVGGTIPYAAWEEDRQEGSTQGSKEKKFYLIYIFIYS